MTSPLPSAPVVEDLADAFDHPVFLLDAERRIVSANRTGRAYVKNIWSRELRSGDSMDRYSAPDALETFRQNHARAMAGERVVVHRSIRYPNGQERFFRVCYQPTRGAEGRVHGVLFFAEDRTEELASTARQQLHEAALSQSAHGVAIGSATEVGYPLVYVNPGFEQLTGYAREEILGQSCRFLQGPATDPEVAEQLRRALRDGLPIRVEILNYRKDGTTFWNDVSLFPVRNDAGELTHVVGTQVDVSERHRLQERMAVAERLEALGLFAGGVAHDFNNLLAALVLNLEALEQEHGASEESAAIGAIVERASALTDSLLNFSRVGSATRKPIDLSSRLRKLAQMLDPLLGATTDLRLRLPGEALSLRADPSQIDQVVMNLVLNARDADAKQITVDAWLEPEGDDQPAAVVIAVSDDGEGMSESVRQRAFEPLFTTRPEGHGTGLGLATVHRAVTRHDGTVALESEPGEGTTVRLRFPEWSGSAPT